MEGSKTRIKMFIRNIYKVLFGALVLLPLASACSSDDEDFEEWLLPDNENSTSFVEFDAMVHDMQGQSEDVTDMLLNEFQLYGFNTALGYSVFGNTRSTTPQSVTVTRNQDDPSQWDYKDPATGKVLKWDNLLKYPVSFYGIAGGGASLVTLGTKNKLATLKVEMPLGKDGCVSSSDTRDLLFATALRLTPWQYMNDSTKIELPFQHILPQVALSASLANANDLEVTIQSATLMGFTTAAEYDFNEAYPQWTAYTPAKGKANADIVMQLSEEVSLSEMPSALQDSPAFIVPQSVKAWTSAARSDGAGIKLMARIRSKASQQYLVGAENGYGEIYVPIDATTFASNTGYTLQVSFSSLYNADGSLGYRATYKPVVTPWNHKEDNLIFE